jgi:hypothetical protein
MNLKESENEIILTRTVEEFQHVNSIKQVLNFKLYKIHKYKIFINLTTPQ